MMRPLSEAVEISASIASRQSDAMDRVLIEAINRRARVLSTDGVSSASIVAEWTGPDMRISAPASGLSKSMKAIGDGAELEVDGPWLRVSNGHRMISLLMVDPDMFPDLPVDRDLEGDEIELDVMARATRTLAPLASSTPPMDIVQYRTVDGEPRAMVANGAQAISSFGGIEGIEWCGAMAVSIASALRAGAPDRARLDGSMLHLWHGDDRLSVRVRLDGMADIHRIVSSVVDHEAEIDRQQLIEAMDLAVLATNERLSPVVVKPGDGCVVVRSRIDGTTTTSEVESSGFLPRMIVSQHHIARVLKLMTGEKIQAAVTMHNKTVYSIRLSDGKSIATTATMQRGDMDDL